jgi:hypothetical protein
MHDAEHLHRIIAEALKRACDRIDDLFMRSKAAVTLLWKYRRRVLRIIRAAEHLESKAVVADAIDMGHIHGLDAEVYNGILGVCYAINPNAPVAVTNRSKPGDDEVTEVIFTEPWDMWL